MNWNDPLTWAEDPLIPQAPSLPREAKPTMSDRKVMKMADSIGPEHSTEEALRRFAERVEDKSKKSRWDLLRFKVLDTIGVVMAAGDGKHQDTHGWAKKPVDYHFAAMMRHISLWRSGETYDNGPGGVGTHHLSNAMCRMMFILAIELGDLPK